MPFFPPVPMGGGGGGGAAPPRLLSPLEKIIYSDYAFDLPSMATFEGRSQGEATWINWEAKYNFYNRDYEKALSSTRDYAPQGIHGSNKVPEIILPNLYVLLHEISRLVTDPARRPELSGGEAVDPSIFWKHITLNDSIKDVLVDIFDDGRKVGDESKGQYYSKWADEINRLVREYFTSLNPPVASYDPVTGEMRRDAAGNPIAATEEELNAPVTNLLPESMTTEGAILIQRGYDQLEVPIPEYLRLGGGSLTIPGQADATTTLPGVTTSYTPPTWEELMAAAGGEQELLEELENQRLRSPQNPSLDTATFTLIQQKFRDWLPRYKNLVIPIASVAAFNQFHKKRVMFPMSVEISFKTDSVPIGGGINQSFGDMFRDANAFDSLIQGLINNLTLTQDGKDIEEWSSWMNVDRSYADTDGTIRTEFVRYWNLGKFLLDATETGSSGRAALDQVPKTGSVFLRSPALEAAGAISAAMSGVLTGNCSNATAIEMYSLLQQMNLIITGESGPNSSGNSTSSLARNYQQIIAGDKAYSETLLYRIEKRNAQTNKFIQNIWFPNSTEVDVLNYVDTQVVYGVDYQYTIYAYQLVVGNNYRYKIDKLPEASTHPYAIYTDKNAAIGATAIPYNDEIANEPFLKSDWITFVNQMFTCNGVVPPESGRCGEQVGNLNTQNPLDADLAEICVLTEPSICLFEIEQYSFVTKAIDRPPIAPNVDIHEYMGISDKLLFNLRSGTGKYYEPFVMMSEDDSVLLNSYITNQSYRHRLDQGMGDEYSFYGQRNTTSGVPIEFRNDDPTNTFDVWRTTQKPTEWSDFKFYKRISSAGFFAQPGKAASGASFEDDIRPNVKYYYTFRAIDVHGNASNPSPVYEVEIIDDKGSSYMNLRTYPSPKPIDPRTPTKDARRYVQIKPSGQQTAVDEEASRLVDSNGVRIPDLSVINTTAQQVILGGNAESVWSSDQTPKKFKIRLTSKKTGKKIDFNVYCKTSNIYNSNI